MYDKMKFSNKETIKNIIKAVMPCEVCGNTDISMFLVRGQLEPLFTYIKCKECNKITPFELVIDE